MKQYIKDEDIKVGNMFRGLVNNDIFKIKEIKNGDSIWADTKYVILEIVRCHKGIQTVATTLDWFKCLQLERIEEV